MERLKRILLIEDDPDIQAVARLALEVGDFEVEVCGNGADAPALVERFAPDLILLDVMMPGLDGPSTLRLLPQQPQSAAIPVIFLTAKVQGREPETYRSLGAIDVIAKPFDPMTLAETVRDIWLAKMANR